MFSDCYKLKEIKGFEKFDTGKVKEMFTMFYNCKELEYLDLSNFKISDDTNIEDMFLGCKAME